MVTCYRRPRDPEAAHDGKFLGSFGRPGSGSLFMRLSRTQVPENFGLLGHRANKGERQGGVICGVK